MAFLKRKSKKKQKKTSYLPQRSQLAVHSAPVKLQRKRKEKGTVNGVPKKKNKKKNKKKLRTYPNEVNWQSRSAPVKLQRKEKKKERLIAFLKRKSKKKTKKNFVPTSTKTIDR